MIRIDQICVDNSFSTLLPLLVLNETVTNKLKCFDQTYLL